jgi:hypothetical protein
VKRIFAAILCLIPAALLWAEAEVLDKPRRTLEWGMDLGLDFANSYLGPSDIFTPAKVIKISLDEFAKRSFDVSAAAETELFIAFDSGRGVNFRIFAGVQSLFYASLSKEITQFVGAGNPDTPSFQGSGSLGLSVFLDAGIRGTAKVNRWTFSAAPSLFIPLAYAQKQEVKVNFEGEEYLKAQASADMIVHSLVPLIDEEGEMFPDNPSPANTGAGIDMTMMAGYALFPWLDLGGIIRNCPIFPAKLEDYTRVTMTAGFDMGEEGLLDLAQGGDFDLGDKLTGPDFDYKPGRDSKYIFRPLGFEVNALYKPVYNKVIKIGLKPSLGFSVLTIYDEFCFNWGLEGRVDLGPVFALTLASGLREKIWKQSLDLELNMKILELDLGIAFQSQDFIGSFMARGLNASLGFRLGW